MAAKKKEQTALAPAESAALAGADTELDALAALGDDLGDGLEDAGKDDWRLPVRLLNMKGTDGDGNPHVPNQWFDTIAERQQPSMRAVCLAMSKTREFREFDNKEDKTKTYCRSFDNVVGDVSDDGKALGLPDTLKCDGCPNYQWSTDPETKKRSRKCGDVYNTAWIDQDTGEPFVIRFRRTGIKPWKTHMQKHHLGRLIRKGQPPRNVPLFAHVVELSAEMADGGKYALPVLKVVEPLPIEEVRLFGQQSVNTKEAMGAIVEHAETIDRDSAADTQDGATRSDQFVD